MHTQHTREAASGVQAAHHFPGFVFACRHQHPSCISCVCIDCSSFTREPPQRQERERKGQQIRGILCREHGPYVLTIFLFLFLMFSFFGHSHCSILCLGPVFLQMFYGRNPLLVIDHMSTVGDPDLKRENWQKETPPPSPSAAAAVVMLCRALHSLQRICLANVLW